MLEQVHLRLLPCPRGLPHSIDGSACLPRSIGVGFHDFTFEACSSFTHVTAYQIVRPPKVDFVTRLQSGRLNPSKLLVSYRALPMAARVGPSPTGDLPLGARDRAAARALRHKDQVTFPRAPLQSRKVGFPDSGFGLGFPRVVFPNRWSLSARSHTPQPHTVYLAARPDIHGSSDFHR